MHTKLASHFLLSAFSPFADSSLLVGHFFPPLLLDSSLFLLLSLSLGNCFHNLKSALVVSRLPDHVFVCLLLIFHVVPPSLVVPLLHFFFISSSLPCRSFSVIIWKILSTSCGSSEIGVSWPFDIFSTANLHVYIRRIFEILLLRRSVYRRLILDEICPTSDT